MSLFFQKNHSVALLKLKFISVFSIHNMAASHVIWRPVTSKLPTLSDHIVCTYTVTLFNSIFDSRHRRDPIKDRHPSRPCKC